MQKVVVEILAGPNVGETFEFDRDQILVGRGSQCQMQLASPHVSRQQCELTRQGDQFVLENLGSVNVTYLNDRPIDRVYVQDGDLITFCDVALRVRLPRPGAEVVLDPDRTVAYAQGQSPPGAVPPQGSQARPQPQGPPPQAHAPPPQPPQARPQAQAHAQAPQPSPPRPQPQGQPQPPPAWQPPQQPAPQRPRSQPRATAPQPQQRGPAGGNGARQSQGETTAPPGPLPPGPPPGPPPGHPGGQPSSARVAMAPASVGMGTGLQPALGGYPPGPAGIAPSGSGQHPAMQPRGTGLHAAMPPGPPPGLAAAQGGGHYQQGMGAPPPGMPGLPPGMPGVPPGMPGPAPGHRGPAAPAGSASAVVSARKKRKKGKAGKQPLNIQMVRNIVVAFAALMVLLMLVSFVIGKTGKPPKGTGEQGSGQTDAAPQDGGTAAGPAVSRRDRTDEEIIRDAESAYGTAQTYLRQHRIADENLWIALTNFRQARAELALVDPDFWPAWTADIDPKVAEAEGLLDQKFKDTKLAYIRLYQSNDYERALQELERILRLVPDKNDSRNEYARERIRKLRDIMAGGKKKGRWEDREVE